MPHTHKLNCVRRTVCVVMAVLILVFCAAFLQRRQASKTVYTKELFAMDTFFALRAYGPQAEEALAACEGRVE